AGKGVSYRAAAPEWSRPPAVVGAPQQRLLSATEQVLRDDAAHRAWQARQPVAVPLVYLGVRGSRYHKEDCGALADGKTALYLAEAQGQGKQPCAVCKPAGW